MTFILVESYFISLVLALALGTGINDESENQKLQQIHETQEREVPQHIKNKFLYYLSGYDYDDKPVVVLEWGKWDFQGVAEKGGDDLQYTLILLDEVLDRIQGGYFNKNGSDSTYIDNDIVVILDFEGLRIGQVKSPPTLKLILQRMIKMGKVYKNIAYGFIINANVVADQVMNLAKPFIGNFLEKMEIYGTNSRKWMPKILKKIPRSELHPAYGGYNDFQPIAVYG